MWGNTKKCKGVEIKRKCSIEQDVKSIYRKLHLYKKAILTERMVRWGVCKIHLSNIRKVHHFSNHFTNVFHWDDWKLCFWNEFSTTAVIIQWFFKKQSADLIMAIH